MFFFPFYRILVLTHKFANANSKTELSPQPIRDLLHSCKRFIGAYDHLTWFIPCAIWFLSFTRYLKKITKLHNFDANSKKWSYHTAISFSDFHKCFITKTIQSSRDQNIDWYYNLHLDLVVCPRYILLVGARMTTNIFAILPSVSLSVFLFTSLWASLSVCLFAPAVSISQTVG